MSSRRDMRSQAGLTLIEVMVAMVIALASTAFTVELINSGSRNALGNERDVQMLAIAQRELETVNQIAKQYGFDAVAMSGAPGTATSAATGNPSDPNSYVSGGSLAIRSDYNDASAPAVYATASGTTGSTKAAPTSEPLIVGGTSTYPTAGRVAPVTRYVASGALQADVYRFVTYDATGGCPTSVDCSGDARRVTIAVVPVAKGAERDPATGVTGTTGNTTLQRVKPVWLSTVLSSPNPKASSAQSGGSVALAVGLP